MQALCEKSYQSVWRMLERKVAARRIRKGKGGWGGQKETLAGSGAEERSPAGIQGWS